jgi:hypothetical protein
VNVLLAPGPFNRVRFGSTELGCPSGRVADPSHLATGETVAYLLQPGKMRCNTVRSVIDLNFPVEKYGT